MVNNGARNLIYVSRSGAGSSETAAFVQDLTVRGVRVEILKCDIANEAALTQALDPVLESMPPIRGVIQGAMVLKDQMFTNMTHDTFINTVRPKVQGSWSLHKATLSQPLDFFILLSSAASFVGNAGQSNYVAACSYQVALSAHRHSLGLPATAIDIGKVKDVGFVAENAGTVSDQNLLRLGMLEIEEQELLTMMEMTMLPRAIGVTNGHMVTGVHSTNDASQRRHGTTTME